MASESTSVRAGGAVEPRAIMAAYVAARVLLEAATFEEAIPKILEAIGEALGWEHAALWVTARERHELRCEYTWHPAAVQFPAFDAASRELRFARGIGLPGRVWATGEPAWIPDVVRDQNFPRAEIAAREGLHGALGFPVRLRGEVLGVLEFFSREIRQPDTAVLAMLRTVGNQIGMFIERRRAQDELDRFFRLSLDMLCVAGFDGYFKRVNPAWKRVLGYSEADLVSRPYIEFVHPEDREATIAAAGQLSEGKEVIYFENRYAHKDGTWRWLVWAAAPFPEQEVIYAGAHDITERKAAEATLTRYADELKAAHVELEDQASRLAQLVKELELSKRRAEEAAETKSAFLANMSHEIRTPLNAILGMTTLALQTRLTSEQYEYLETVKSAADSLLTIINDILDFSKIEARRLDLERTEFDLRETVGDAAKVLALRASEKGLELAVDINADVPDRFVGDPGRLRQVLLNVLGNAIKFTNQGEVVLRVMLERGATDGRVLHFSVTDTGIGIPADKQAHIFQAFTQADSSTTRRYGGTGLGLAIALRLVELMGGRMWVESEVGLGSTFHFTAAFDHPEHAGITPAAVRPAALDGLRVLVVDDNATNRRILLEMLASWHMKPTAVTDTASAIDTLHKSSGDEQFDVVIADCQMPDEDGFMLARRIRHDRRLRDTPIVMLTSVGRKADTARARRLGVNASLTKPVKHSDLLDTLAAVFGVSTRRDGPKRDVPTSPSSARRRLRVLVAEDNAVNRKLVMTLLQKRGHTVVGVDNGRTAVAAIHGSKSSRFDVVVMDVQMPEMSGFEAAQAIRAQEGAGRRLPIVALTAHAMQGDRERCLAAGMDGYLSKPIDVKELVATVERFADGGSSTVAVEPVRPATAIFDERAALAYTGQDRELLEDIVALFRAELPTSLQTIERAVDRHDADALRLAAHALKGSVATLGSSAAREAAADLEQMGRSNEFSRAGVAVSTLRSHLSRLDEALVAAGLVRQRTRPAQSRKRRISRRKESRSHEQHSRRRR